MWFNLVGLTGGVVKNLHIFASCFLFTWYILLEFYDPINVDNLAGSARRYNIFDGVFIICSDTIE